MVEVLPNIRWLDTKPELVEFISANRSADRIMQTVEYADPFWRVPMITAPLRQAERLELEAFKMKVGNGMTSVYYQPKHICVPRAYWGDGDNPILNDAGNLVSVTGNTLVINGVTTGLHLMPGDLISLSTAGFVRNVMVQVTSDSTAVAGSITITAYPALPAYIVAGAVATFKDPIMNTRVVPGSFDIPSGKFPTCSFVLQEVPL